MAGIKDRKVKNVFLLNAVQPTLPGTNTSNLRPSSDASITLDPAGVLYEHLKGSTLIPWSNVLAVYFAE